MGGLLWAQYFLIVLYFASYYIFCGTTLSAVLLFNSPLCISDGDISPFGVERGFPSLLAVSQGEREQSPSGLSWPDFLVFIRPFSFFFFSFSFESAERRVEERRNV